MPKCAHCGQQWSYSDTLNVLFRMKMKCRCCQKGNYHSAKGRKRSMLFSIILAPLFGVAGTLLSSFIWAAPLAIFMLLIIFIIYPFMIETSKEEEPLW